MLTREGVRNFRNFKLVGKKEVLKENGYVFKRNNIRVLK